MGNNKVVILENVKYRGKADKIKWKLVEKDLKSLISKTATIDEYNEEIVIGSDFPDEFTSSNYTIRLLGPLKKAKANMSTVILELAKNATNKRFQDNKDDKHNIDAKYGWERFDVYFKIPVTNENGEVIQNNNYVSTMIVRLDADGKKYLYDFINIKKGKCDPHG